MLFEIRSLIQNRVMGVPGVQRLTEALHSTGINGDDTVARETFAIYRRFVPVVDQRILELGPGQSPQVLELAKAAGARTCAAVDTHVYRTAEAARGRGIEISAYDGVHLPFSGDSFDVIWSSDVFEHVRRPEPLLRDTFRVLRQRGRFLARVDLRDHYYLHDERRWLECLRYPDFLWRAMTSNRSSFVNRLRYGHWRQLFRDVGYREVALEPKRSAIIAEAYSAGRIRSWSALSMDDAPVVGFDCVYEKP